MKLSVLNLKVRNICKCQEALEAAASPCLSCMNRPSCQIATAQRLLFEQPNDEANVKHLVASCSAYRREGELRRCRHGDESREPAARGSEHEKMLRAPYPRRPGERRRRRDHELG